MRSTSPTNARTSSPTFTGCAGFARSPFTFRCPALQASDAADRVLKSRTAQAQESTRTLPGPDAPDAPDAPDFAGVPGISHRLFGQRRLPLHQAAHGSAAVGRELLHHVGRHEVVHGHPAADGLRAVVGELAE